MTSIALAYSPSPRRVVVTFDNDLATEGTARIAVLNPDNYLIIPESRGSLPTVLSVELKNPRTVILETTEMRNGANYAIFVNSSGLLFNAEDEILEDADMEAVDTSAWESSDGTILSKVPLSSNEDFVFQQDGLLAWYKVESESDESGLQSKHIYTYTFSQTSGFGTPDFVADGINGKPGLDISEVRFTNSNGLGDLLGSGGEEKNFTISIVCAVSRETGQAPTVVSFTTDPETLAGFRFGVITSSKIPYIGTAPTVESNTTTSFEDFVIDDQPHVWTFRRKGLTFELYLDGVFVGSKTSPSPFPDLPRLNVSQTNWDYYVLGAMVIHDRALSDEERERQEMLLAAEYGIGQALKVERDSGTLTREAWQSVSIDRRGHYIIGGRFKGGTGNLAVGQYSREFKGQEGIWKNFGPFLFKAPGRGNVNIFFRSFADFELDNLFLRPLFGIPDPNKNLKDYQGNVVNSKGHVFNARGEVASIQVVHATDSNTAVIKFTHLVGNSENIFKVDSYSFNNGLEVLEVVEFDGLSITLKTSDQEALQLYELTINFEIFDSAGNSLGETLQSPMLGFFSLEDQEQLFSLKIYNFLFEGLRDEDQKNGALLERFLQGAQEIWDEQIKKILEIPKIWNLVYMDDRLLKYQKSILGWGKDLDYITNNLDDLTLRRVMANSISFWKNRGSENGIDGIIQLTTGLEVEVENWFDVRQFWDETTIEDGPVLYDPNAYYVNVIDKDSLADRNVVRGLVRLSRPINERAYIIYHLFRDKFESENSYNNWNFYDTSISPLPLPPSGQIENGKLKIGSDSGPTFDVEIKPEIFQNWIGGYSVRFKASVQSFFSLVLFHIGFDDEEHLDNGYLFHFYISQFSLNPFIEVIRAISGSGPALTNELTGVGQTDLSNILKDFNFEEFHTYHMVIKTIGSSNLIIVFIDNEIVFRAVDTSPNGLFGGGLYFKIAQMVEIEEIDVMPLDGSEFIDINS